MNSPSVCNVDSSLDWREKLFADLLQFVRLRSSVYFRPELRAPWGFRVADHGTAFHIVADGKCWVQVTGAEKVELVASGDAHIMRDSAASTIVGRVCSYPDFFELAAYSAPDSNPENRIFRAVRKSGTISESLSPTAVWKIVLHYARNTGIRELTPHSTRESDVGL